MNIDSAFPSKYLKASDITESTIVTIRGFDIEALQDGSEKPVLYFEETEKGLICNKTNAAMITAILKTGETDAWIGKQIILKPERVQYMNQMVAGIRVGDPRPPKTNGFGLAGGRKPAAPAAPADDDVPSEWPADEGIPDPGDPMTARMKNKK